MMNLKSTFYLPLLTVILFFLMFSSCEKDSIETIPLESVTGEILETVDYGEKSFIFNFKTDLETYPVTYLIRSEHSVNGNQINISLLDIQKDDYDDLNIIKGPASCTINLGTLADGEYNLQVKVSNQTNSGTLRILDDQLILDMPESAKLSVAHDTINRIPFGAVWGYVGYQSVSNGSIASNFINTMVTMGAEPLELSPGYYGYFSISDSGDFVQPIDENYTYYKEFLKNYTGSAAALDEHISYYNTEFYNKADVIIYWFWDGNSK